MLPAETTLRNQAKTALYTVLILILGHGAQHFKR